MVNCLFIMVFYWIMVFLTDRDTACQMIQSAGTAPSAAISSASCPDLLPVD